MPRFLPLFTLLALLGYNSQLALSGPLNILPKYLPPESRQLTRGVNCADIYRRILSRHPLTPAVFSVIPGHFELLEYSSKRVTIAVFYDQPDLEKVAIYRDDVYSNDQIEAAKKTMGPRDYGPIGAGPADWVIRRFVGFEHYPAQNQSRLWRDHRGVTYVVYETRDSLTKTGILVPMSDGSIGLSLTRTGEIINLSNLGSSEHVRILLSVSK